MAPGSSCASRACVTASIVPGTSSCPCLIRPLSSRTTFSAALTASGSPSSVSRLPRRNTSQSMCSIRLLRILSPLPANSAAAVLSSSIWVRIRLLYEVTRQGGSHRFRRPLAVNQATGLIHHHLHHRTDVPGAGGAGPGNRLGDDLVELIVAQIGWQIARDHLGLRLLLVFKIGSVGVPELRGRIQPPLVLAPQNSELVAVSFLHVLLKLGDEQAQGSGDIPLARLHRANHVRAHLFENVQLKKRIRRVGDVMKGLTGPEHPDRPVRHRMGTAPPDRSDGRAAPCRRGRGGTASPPTNPRSAATCDRGRAARRGA